MGDRFWIWGPRAAVALILVLLGVLVFAMNSAVTGDDRASLALPDEVERLIPASGATVPRQGEIGIDVADGYDAYLVVDGTTIDQPLAMTADGITPVSDGLRRNSTSGLITYSPRKGGLVESLGEGTSCVQAVVWKIGEPRTTGRTVRWCFRTS